MKDNNLKQKAKSILSKKKSLLSHDLKNLQLDELLHEIDVYNAELEAQNEELIEKEVVLKDSLGFNELIFDEAPFAYFCLDKNFNILKANHMAYSIFSIPLSSRGNNIFYKFVAKGNLGLFLDWVQSNEFEIKPLEINLVCHDEIRRYRIFLKKLDTNEGFYLMNLLDIQEEYLLKKLSEENNKILYEIAQYQSDMLVIYDKNYHIKFANNSFLKFYDVKDIDEFKQQYKYICATFIKKDNFFHALKIDYKSKETHWTTKIDRLDDSKSVVCICEKKSKTEKFFMVNISKTLRNELICTFSEITNLSLQREEFREKSYTDELTKIYNRAKFNEFLEHEFSFFFRGKIDLSLIMFDIDFFKNVNDNYGHDIGDKVLVELCSRVEKHVRKADVFARWGGEEFSILLKECDFEHSLSFAEIIRQKIEKHIFCENIKITCSFGVANAHKSDTIETFTKKADLALYKAKNSGRNCVES